MSNKKKAVVLSSGGLDSTTVLAIARDDESGRGEFRQPHWSTRVELLSRDPDLGTEAELATVGEAG